MTIDIQYIQLSLSANFTTFLFKKLEKLSLKSNEIVSVKVSLRNENEFNALTKICALQIVLPGKVLYARSKQSSFVLAVNGAFQEVLLQLQKYKNKSKINRRQRARVA